MGELGKRFRQHMVLRGFAEATKESYEHAMVDLVRAYNGKSPDQLTDEQIQAHVASLTEHRGARSTSTSARTGVSFTAC